jgi:hypothetical protein
MSTLDTNNVLLREGLGKGKTTILEGGENTTGGDFYAAYFPVATKLAGITFGGGTTISGAAGTTFDTLVLAAGTTILLRMTGISITTGMVILYTEEDQRVSE